MRFLKESINTISKEASLFIHEHPEFTEQIKQFEDFIDIKRTLQFDNNLLEFVNQFFNNDKLEYHKKHQNNDNEEYSIDCYDFDLDTPDIQEASYNIKDNQLYIEGYANYYGQSYINNDEDMKGPIINAYHDFSIKIPEDVYDIDLYEYNDLECGGYYYQED